jgi:ferredoxin-NADP reductase
VITSPRCGEGHGALRRGRATLRITVKDLGDGSRSLADLRPGTRGRSRARTGGCTRASVRTRTKVALMASGIGITPLRIVDHAVENCPTAAGTLVGAVQ